MLHSRAIVMYHPDHEHNPDDSRVVCRQELPRISARWTPEQVLRRDTDAGTFEHINPRDYGNHALYLQQALLYEPRPFSFSFSFSWAVALTWGGAAAFWVLVALLVSAHWSSP